VLDALLIPASLVVAFMAGMLFMWIILADSED